jgi:hypothetical protein
MIDEQTFREALGAVFFALLADRDVTSARASADVLNGAVETGAIHDPAARGVIRSIVKSARAAELLS